MHYVFFILEYTVYFYIYRHNFIILHGSYAMIIMRQINYILESILTQYRFAALII